MEPVELTAFWVEGDAGHSQELDRSSLRALGERVVDGRVQRAELIGRGSRAAVLVHHQRSVRVELMTGDVRHILRTGPRRATKCCVGGKDRILSSDGIQNTEVAVDGAVNWMKYGVAPAGMIAHPVLSSGQMDDASAHRSRMYDGVENYLRLRGRHLVTDADTYAFLIGTIRIAGATRMTLTEVTNRSAPAGPRASDVELFAATVDADHEKAHRMATGDERRVWLAGRLSESVRAAGTSEASTLMESMRAYVGCELGRSRVVVR